MTNNIPALNQGITQKKEVFIANGIKFDSFEAVQTYCRENGFRITNAGTYRNHNYTNNIGVRFHLMDIREVQR